jgi:hypothetical protein
MNENPTQDRPEIPPGTPNNPYRTRTGDIVASYGTPHEPRAKGLDGDALDSLLKSRMVEGMRLGHEDGYQAAAKAYPNIYDEGWRLGVDEGYGMGRQSTAEPLLDGIGRAQAALMQIAAKAKKGGFTEQIADSALDALRDAVQAIR